MGSYYEYLYIKELPVNKKNRDENLDENWKPKR